jgi:hypothetical protein
MVSEFLSALPFQIAPFQIAPAAENFRLSRFGANATTASPHPDLRRDHAQKVT